jgi:hypothetical protein
LRRTTGARRTAACARPAFDPIRAGLRHAPLRAEA